MNSFAPKTVRRSLLTIRRLPVNFGFQQSFILSHRLILPTQAQTRSLNVLSSTEKSNFAKSYFFRSRQNQDSFLQAPQFVLSVITLRDWSQEKLQHHELALKIRLPNLRQPLCPMCPKRLKQICVRPCERCYTAQKCCRAKSPKVENCRLLLATHKKMP